MFSSLSELINNGGPRAPAAAAHTFGAVTACAGVWSATDTQFQWWSTPAADIDAEGGADD
jgi:hypothetical protein